MILTPKKGCCEEASPASQDHYIPCNAPANTVLYSEKDGRHYIMCSPCSAHNLTRGMEWVGAIAKSPPVENP